MSIIKIAAVASAGYMLRLTQDAVAATSRFDWTPVIAGLFALAMLAINVYGAYKTKQLEVRTKDIETKAIAIDEKVEEVKIVAKQTEISTNSTASTLKAIADEREKELNAVKLENATLKERMTWVQSQAGPSGVPTPKEST